MHPYLNPRTEHDLIGDLEEAFANWYKLKKGEDVADVCGHICMRLGRCDKALKFLQVSLQLDVVVQVCLPLSVYSETDLEFQCSVACGRATVCCFRRARTWSLSALIRRPTLTSQAATRSKAN